MDSLSFGVDGREDFNSAASALARENRKLPRVFIAEITRIAKVFAKEASAKALTIPAEKGKHTGLRKEVSKGVFVLKQPENGGVRIGTTMPHEDEAIIPRGWDAGISNGWRHPIFATGTDRKKWKWIKHKQRGTFSWFEETLEGAGPVITQKFSDELDDAADRIDRRS